MGAISTCTQFWSAKRSHYNVSFEGPQIIGGWEYIGWESIPLRDSAAEKGIKLSLSSRRYGFDSMWMHSQPSTCGTGPKSGCGDKVEKLFRALPMIKAIKDAETGNIAP